MIANDVISEVRRTLRDDFPSSYHWTDDVLIGYLVDAQAEINSLRADLRLNADGTLATFDASVADLDATLFLGDTMKLPLADYVVSRALAEDDPDMGNAAQSKMHMERFYRRLGFNG